MADRRSAVWHWRDEVTVRLQVSRVNTSSNASSPARPSRTGELCRAQASSMPAGPAIGRVDAERRALTTTSTAPESKTRWSLRSDLDARTVRLLPHPAPTPVVLFARKRDTRAGPRPGLRSGRACGAVVLQHLGTHAAGCGTGSRWRERPSVGALGSGARHEGGVVHAIVSGAACTAACLGEAADSAACPCRGQQSPARQAFAGASSAWLTKGGRGLGEASETGGPT